MEQVEHLKLSGQLPSPRGIALAILELSRRDRVTLAEIARIVQSPGTPFIYYGEEYRHAR